MLVEGPIAGSLPSSSCSRPWRIGGGGGSQMLDSLRAVERLHAGCSCSGLHIKNSDPRELLGFPYEQDLTPTMEGIARSIQRGDASTTANLMGLIDRECIDPLRRIVVASSSGRRQSRVVERLLEGVEGFEPGHQKPFRYLVEGFAVAGRDAIVRYERLHVASIRGEPVRTIDVDDSVGNVLSLGNRLYDICMVKWCINHSSNTNVIIYAGANHHDHVDFFLTNLFGYTTTATAAGSVGAGEWQPTTKKKHMRMSKRKIHGQKGS